MPNRVVVTGIGCMSSIGLSISDAWKAALDGETGVKPITLLDTTEYAVHIAAEISDWTPDSYMDGKQAKRCDRFTQFAVAAATQAIEDAELQINEDNAWDVGVVIGSGIGGMMTWEEQHERLITKGPSRVSPFLVPMMIVDMAAGMVSIVHGAKGPNYAAVSACASSTHAVGECFEIIKRGAAKAMITGGSEGAITATGLGGFCAAKALSTRNDQPKTACRPFDRTRDGFVMGEGSCILILEDLEHALSRGAKIYGEIVGYGMTGDAYNIVAPDPTGMGAMKAMEFALKEAGFSATDVDYVNAHAPGTPEGDNMEARALQMLYDGQDYSPIVSSTKGNHGHMLGATGSMELALSLMMMRDGIVSRTLNCNELDEGIWLDVAKGEHREKRIDTVMSNSFGFGGHNATIVAKRYED